MPRESEGTIALMAHLIAGYPDNESSVVAGEALVAGGARYLEVQFPYSDPTADGPAIQAACSAALEGGFKVGLGFEIVAEIVSATEVPVFVMGYAGLVYARGIESFVEEAKTAGAAGLIVPDLMPGYDEGLYEAGRRLGLPVIPVITPHIDREREEEVMATTPEYVYVALRAGITGSRTDLDAEGLDFLKRIGTYKTGEGSPVRVMAGFGIKENKQIELLAPHIYASIIGSAFVGRIGDLVKQGLPIYEGLKVFTRDLCTISS